MQALSATTFLPSTVQPLLSKLAHLLYNPLSFYPSGF